MEHHLTTALGKGRDLDAVNGQEPAGFEWVPIVGCSADIARHGDVRFFVCPVFGSRDSGPISRCRKNP